MRLPRTLQFPALRSGLRLTSMTDNFRILLLYRLI
jgi:hypothetical protein